MTLYTLGQVISGAFTVRDDAGDLADADSVSITLTAPDGTSSALAETRTGTGVYQWAFEPDQPGRWTVREVAVQPDCAMVVRQFDVWPANPRLLIPLADARAALNLATSNTGNDDELQLYIAAATYVIEDIAGPVLADSVSETFDGGRTAVLLSRKAAAITSVVESGATLDSADYTADLAAGILYAGGQSSPRTFAYGRQNITVSYAVGSGVVPPNVILACRELVQHSYQIGQQARHPAFGEIIEAQDTAYTPSGFVVPRRVLEWCQPEAGNRMPGIA